jgi:hypothetical protein
VIQFDVMFCLQKVSHRFEVDNNVKQYMSKPQDYIDFDFFDPTDALVILLTMSPLATDRNLQLFPRHSEWLEDFCDGARMHRTADALPHGSAALSSILFFDGILRDAKGFTL